jgi:hypothetical protein
MGRWDKIIESMPRYAGLGGAAALGGAALMSPDDANAAGIQTIMSKLGVGLEEAKKIKDLAVQKLPEGVFEENIRALQPLNQFKRSYANPFIKLGSGMDYKAYATPQGVLKVPMKGNWSHGTVDPTAQYAPSLVEQAGLGPKTKTIQLGGRQYMLQEPVTPMDVIAKGTNRQSGDTVLEDLHKQLDRVWMENLDPHSDDIKIKPEFQNQVREIEDNIKKRRNELYKQSGIDPADLEKQYSSLPAKERAQFYNVETPEEMFEKLMQLKAEKALGSKIVPFDLHSGNIGLNAQKQPTIFDTSRFRNFKPENLTPEERQKILDSNIMLPQYKNELKENLNTPGSFASERDWDTGIEDSSVKPKKIFNPINNKANWTKDANGNWREKEVSFETPETPEIRRIPVRDEDWTKDSKGDLMLKPSKVAAGLGGAAALGGLASGANQASAESLSPVPSIERGLNAIREPIANAAQKASDAIVSGTTPLIGPEKQQFVEQNAPIFGGIAQMASDPLNYIPGGPELDLAMQFPKLKRYLQGQ